MDSPSPRKRTRFVRSTPLPHQVNSDENIDDRSSTISSIHGSKEPSISGSSIQSSEKYSEYIGEDYDAYFINVERIRRTGQVWKLYRPDGLEDTLYGKILLDPANADTIAAELLDTYEWNSEDVVRSLIMLFINLSGYTEFELNGHFNVTQSEECSKENIKLLESKRVILRNQLVMDARYLLSEKPVTLAKTLQNGVYNFIQKLVRRAHLKRILYRESFIYCLCEFVNCMQTSDLRCIMHTGVLIGVKLLTAMVLVKNDIISDSDYMMASSPDDLNSSKSIELEEQNSSIDIFIQALYMAFRKNCRLHDPRIFQMKVECIIEAKIWIKYFPKFFISSFLALDYIEKLIKDGSKQVRMAALCAIEDLFNIPAAYNILKNMIGLAKTIGGRFVDVDVNVAVKAINIFSLFLDSASTLISGELFRQITNLIFNERAPVGKAACNFFSRYFDKQRKSSHYVIQTIIACYPMNRGDCSKELVVEGFLYQCSSLRNWTAYCETLLREGVDVDKKIAVAELFSEAVFQYVTGVTSKPRKMSTQNVAVDHTIHEKIAQLLPTLLQILKEQNDPKIRLEIMKVVSMVDRYHMPNFCNYCNDFKKMLEMVASIFNNSDDEKLLKKSVELAVHLNSFLRAKNFDENFCNDTMTLLFGSSILDVSRSVVKRLSVLIQFFDLNSLLNFGFLTNSIDDVSDEVKVDLLTCCAWYLIWELRKFTKDPRSLTEEYRDKVLSELPKYCKIFSNIVFSLLQSGDIEHQLLLQMYIGLCDFYLLFNEELQAPIKILRFFEYLTLKIDKQEILLKVLEENVIDNKNLSLWDRRTYVVKYINLIHADIVPIQNLTNIYKYYYSMNKEYGPLIDQSLMKLAATCVDQTVIFLVAITLKNVYDQILLRHTVVDRRTEGAIQLKTLAKQFATFKYFQKCDNDIIQNLIYLLVRTAFKTSDMIPYLYIIVPFLDLIKDDKVRKHLINWFKENCPVNIQKDDAVLYFVQELRKGPKSAKKDAKKATPKKGKTQKTKSKTSKDLDIDTEANTESNGISELSDIENEVPTSTPLPGTSKGKKQPKKKNVQPKAKPKPRPRRTSARSKPKFPLTLPPRSDSSSEEELNIEDSDGDFSETMSTINATTVDKENQPPVKAKGKPRKVVVSTPKKRSFRPDYDDAEDAINILHSDDDD